MSSDFTSKGFKDLVRGTIERYQMLEKGDAVVVGLSGGADSIALVSVLNSIKSEYSLKIVATHVNHGLRGAEADRDESFVKDFCNDRGIECHVLHADVPKMAKESSESFEACGRKVRYGFYAEIARKLALDNPSLMGKVKIATAHNAQDAVETLLFNLSRGTGLKGLCSIPPVRKYEDLLVVRPIIEATREEIEEYLNEKGISFVTDSTNFDTDYSRNRIRINVLPELEKLNDGAIKNIARCASQLRDVDNFIEDNVSRLILDSRLEKPQKNGVLAQYNAEKLASVPFALSSRAIAEILFKETGCHQENYHIETVCRMLSSKGQIQLVGGFFARVEKGKLLIASMDAGSSVNDISSKVDIEIDKESLIDSPFEVDFFDKKIKFEVKPNEGKILLEKSFDYDKIVSKFHLRNRKNGDKFTLPKRRITKTLKNLFNEAKIPLEERQSLCILESDGRIIYVEGFGVAYDFRVTPDTTKVLTIEIS